MCWKAALSRSVAFAHLIAAGADVEMSFVPRKGTVPSLSQLIARLIANLARTFSERNDYRRGSENPGLSASPHTGTYA